MDIIMSELLPTYAEAHGLLTSYSLKRKSSAETIKYLFLYSLKDPAGVNMARYLEDTIPFQESDYPNIKIYGDYALTYTENDIVYTDYIDSNLPFKPDTIIFLSRHSSVKEYPTLTAHVTGNPTDKADYGGKPYSLARSNPRLMKNIIIELKKLRDERELDYDVRMEVTHHGPTDIYSKVVFVEVGSTLRQWNDQKAVNTVVDAVLNVLKKKSDYPTCVGFGGPHYAPLFTKIDLDEEYAVGHIFSKYVLSSNIKWDVILKAFEYSDSARIAVLEWKGIKGGVRQQLKDFLMDRGFEVVKR